MNDELHTMNDELHLSQRILDDLPIDLWKYLLDFKEYILAADVKLPSTYKTDEAVYQVSLQPLVTVTLMGRNEADDDTVFFHLTFYREGDYWDFTKDHDDDDKMCNPFTP